MRKVVVLLVMALLALQACGDEPVAEPVDGDGPGGKADENAFTAALAGREDPIGKWLRDKSNVDEKGQLETDYVQVVLGIAEQEGCAVDGVKTFLISDSLLTGADPFPRTVTSVCASDPARAADVFLSAPEATEDGDIEERVIEMFAWDPKLGSYRFYRVDPVEGQQFRVQVDADPSECRNCHLGSTQMDPTFIPMAPVMNELTLPWQHWNAAPDFESVDFELSEEVQGKEGYNRSVAPWLGSAPNLEAIIRKGFERVNGERLKARRNKPASVAESMALLRPLFCNERINFVTEDSGTVTTAVYLDEGITNMLKTLDGGVWPWAWYNDKKVRLGEPIDGKLLNMVAIRGAADVDYEQRLVSVRGLEAGQVMRVKALDWKRPVFSTFRCGLWVDANERLRIQPPEVSSEARNLNLMATLFEEIMTVASADGTRVSLAPPVGSAVIAVDLADEVTINLLAESIKGGAVAQSACDAQTGAGFCAVGLQGFGDLIEAHIKVIEADPGARDKMAQIRNARACIAKEFYKNSPDIPEVGACEGAEGSRE